ncbi:MAG: hypothetical protein ABL962_08980 [Fimbriimonadaceae bacterium]
MRSKQHHLPDSEYKGERTVSFTACVVPRRSVFVTPEIVEPLVKILGGCTYRFSCFVPIYCFMPDHLHVMLKGIGFEGMPMEAMKSFKRLSGQHFSRCRFDFGWQVNFHDHIVRSREDWRGQARYIALNPVRAGLCEDIFDYPFTGSIGTDLKEIVSPLDP